MRAFLRTLSLAATLAIAPALMAQPKPAKPAAKAAAAAPAAAQATIDINTATVAELEAFPGIGKATSAKIIKGRPYANKAQLVSKKVMTQAVYDKIKDKLIAKQ